MSSEELIKKWQHVIDEAAHIWTWTEALTAAFLAEQASKSTLACETGVYMGYTSFVMLAANSTLHLWSIDPFMVAGTEKTTRYFLRNFINQGRSEIIPRHTRPAAGQLSHMKGKLDFCFIDDGHALDDVLTDIESMLPLVRPGGMLFGHDYDTIPEANEVAQAVKKLLPDHFQPVPRLWAYIKP